VHPVMSCSQMCGATPSIREATSVDVCVRRLRSKLERGAIETVRNVGYSFVAS
jgi:DNA-binding response OmpR family regulator